MILLQILQFFDQSQDILDQVFNFFVFDLCIFIGCGMGIFSAGLDLSEVEVLFQVGFLGCNCER